MIAWLWYWKWYPGNASANIALYSVNIGREYGLVSALMTAITMYKYCSGWGIFCLYASIMCLIVYYFPTQRSVGVDNRKGLVKPWLKLTVSSILLYHIKLRFKFLENLIIIWNFPGYDSRHTFTTGFGFSPQAHPGAQNVLLITA